MGAGLWEPEAAREKAGSRHLGDCMEPVATICGKMCENQHWWDTLLPKRKLLAPRVIPLRGCLISV